MSNWRLKCSVDTLLLWLLLNLVALALLIHQLNEAHFSYDMALVTLCPHSSGSLTEGRHNSDIVAVCMLSKYSHSALHLQHSSDTFVAPGCWDLLFVELQRKSNIARSCHNVKKQSSVLTSSSLDQFCVCVHLHTYCSTLFTVYKNTDKHTCMHIYRVLCKLLTSISTKWLTLYLLIISKSQCKLQKGTNQTENWVTSDSYATVDTISGLFF